MGAPSVEAGIQGDLQTEWARLFHEADYIPSTDAPEYTQDVLDTTIAEEINLALGVNPWSATPTTGAPTAIDPSLELAAIDTGVTNYKTEVSGIAATTDFATYMNTAETEVEDHIFDADYIDDQVTDMETKLDANLQRSISNLQSGAFLAGAHRGSNLLMGVAFLAADQAATVAARTAEIQERAKQQKSAAIMQGADMMMRLDLAKADHLGGVARAITDANKLRLVAEKEELAEQIQLNRDANTHELDLMNDYALGALAAYQNTPLVKKGPSPLSTAITTAVSTATTVASVASPLGAPAAIGLALLGGAVGGIGGFTSAST